MLVSLTMVSTMDVHIAQYNMLNQQIKPIVNLDQKTISTISSLHREDFVPNDFKKLAYSEAWIPLGNGQYMLPPNIIGQILQSLNLNGTQDVLEIGTGSGYLTALLAKLSRHVTTFETSKQLATQANNRLRAIHVTNVEIINGNAFSAFLAEKVFDFVILTGSITYLPDSIMRSLKNHGRLFAIIGALPIMQACIFTRIKEEAWSKTALFETVVPPLREIVHVKNFEF